MLITLCEFASSPSRAFKIKKNFAYMEEKKYQFKRSQDLEKKFYDTGTLYFFKTNSFLKNKHIFPNKMSFFILNQLNSQDINTKQDLVLAKIKYKLK